jgi:hypothetical protein
VERNTSGGGHEGGQNFFCGLIQFGGLCKEAGSCIVVVKLVLKATGWDLQDQLRWHNGVEGGEEVNVVCIG